MSRPPRPPAPRSPFIAPAWIAAISLVGLVSALLGDGLFDWISWGVLSALIALVVRAWIKRDRR